MAFYRTENIQYIVPARLFLTTSLLAMISFFKKGRKKKKRRKSTLENLTEGKQNDIDLVERCEDKSGKKPPPRTS